MKSPHPKTWSEIAWNGIRFTAPADWLPAELGSRYMLLEEASAPMLEIKWGPIKGRFSHARHLQQLSSRHKKNLRKSIRDWTLPTDWQQALGSFQAGGFQWHTPQFSGTGATLYCPICQNATLIQFYRSSAAFNDQAALKLLASFQDHHEDGRILWSVFDIRAGLPADFKLWRHQFTAGSFELKFRSQTHTVLLNRWSPASVLLNAKDLIGFAAGALSVPSWAAATVSSKPCPTVEWTLAPAAGLRPRWWLSNRLKVLSCLQQLRLWHLESKNRILSVRVEGRRPLALPVFDKICKGFKCV